MHKRVLTKPDGRQLLLYARDAASRRSRRRRARARRRTRRTRTCAGIRCAASGSPTPATGSTARSCRRAEYNPLAPSDRSRRIRPRCRPGRGTSPCSKTCFRRLTHDRARSAGAGGADRAGTRRLRGRGLHAGSRRRRSARCRSGISSCWSRSGPIATRSSARCRTSQYVYPFENRGVEVGVTLHHPHGQIYAYPFVPPVPARELEQQRAYYERHGRGLLEDMVAREARGRRRACSTTGRTSPPSCRSARAIPTRSGSRRARPAPSFAALTADERRDFARALKTVLLKFDGLWNRPFPYILAFHQAPTDGVPHPEAHLHAEFYPGVPHARPAEVSRRQRDRRRRVHRRHRAGREGQGAAGGRRSTSMR